MVEVKGGAVPLDGVAGDDQRQISGPGRVLNGAAVRIVNRKDFLNRYDVPLFSGGIHSCATSLRNSSAAFCSCENVFPSLRLYAVLAPRSLSAC
jgi:hypothetical protein